MGQNFHLISDMGKLAQLKYKKRPIIAEFYTEYPQIDSAGARPASPLAPYSKNNSRNQPENFHWHASIATKQRS